MDCPLTALLLCLVLAVMTLTASDEIHRLRTLAASSWFTVSMLEIPGAGTSQVNSAAGLIHLGRRCDPPGGGDAAQLDALHAAQAGQHRHVCASCAYQRGIEAGIAETSRDRRRRSWTIDEPMELCLESNAAPVAMLAALPSTEGTPRWSCAVCAWMLGVREGVRSVLGV